MPGRYRMNRPPAPENRPRMTGCWPGCSSGKSRGVAIKLEHRRVELQNVLVRDLAGRRGRSANGSCRYGGRSAAREILQVKRAGNATSTERINTKAFFTEILSPPPGPAAKLIQVGLGYGAHNRRQSDKKPLIELRLRWRWLGRPTQPHDGKRSKQHRRLHGHDRGRFQIRAGPRIGDKGEDRLQVEIVDKLRLVINLDQSFVATKPEVLVQPRPREPAADRTRLAGRGSG